MLNDSQKTKDQLLTELTETRQRLTDLEIGGAERSGEVARANAVTAAINEVFQQALTCETEEQLGRTCLDVAEKLTGSKFGLFGEVNEKGLFDTISISNPGWDACDVAVAAAARFIHDMPIRGVDRGTIREGKSRIVTQDEMATHPDHVEWPEGHPPVTAFLGVPLIHEGKTIGMIGLGNKEGGYELADQEAVESLSIAMVEALRHKRAELELRNARDQLVRRERLAVLGQLAGGVGHELRHPLGVITNSIYFLRMVLTEPDEKTKEHLDIMSSQIGTAGQIVADLLDFARIKAIEREELSVAELSAAALSEHPPPEEIHVTTSLAPDLPRAFVDGRQIVQVLRNLIANACQAMPEGGELTLSAEAEGEQVRLSVADTGCGMSEETLSRIFEPLFTTKPRGIGLGLPVCRNFAEANDGRLDVESEEGKGSTFTVTLPTKEGAA